jgi:hypothetical protein
VGQNKTGPYTLGYRKVRDREIVVQVDGRALKETSSVWIGAGER